MKPITPKQRLKRLDFLDYVMTSLFFIVIGIMLGSYNPNWGSYVSSEWVISWFIAIVIAVRPIIRFFR